MCRNMYMLYMRAHMHAEARLIPGTSNPLLPPSPIYRSQGLPDSAGLAQSSSQRDAYPCLCLLALGFQGCSWLLMDTRGQSQSSPTAYSPAHCFTYFLSLGELFGRGPAKNTLLCSTQRLIEHLFPVLSKLPP